MKFTVVVKVQPVGDAEFAERKVLKLRFTTLFKIRMRILVMMWMIQVLMTMIV